jgi:hypothetical protein
MNTSDPVLLCWSNAIFWVICQFDKPNGSARNRRIVYSLFRRRCYARHGVDRPAGLHAGPALPASTSSLVQRGSAAMLKPMIEIPVASLRCAPEALHPRADNPADRVFGPIYVNF